MNESVKIRKKNFKCIKMAMHNAETLAKERLFGSSVHLSCCHLLQMSQKFERRLTKSRQFLSRTPKGKVEEH